MNKNIKVKYVFGVIVLSVLMVCAWVACPRTGPVMYVQVGFPESYKLLSPSHTAGKSFAIFYWTYGIHVIRFSRSGKEYAAVISAEEGGEAYIGLSESDIVPIVVAKELSP